MSIRFRALVCSSVVFVAAATAVLAQTQTPSPAGAAVYFINLKDGDTVTARSRSSSASAAWASRRSACRTAHRSSSPAHRYQTLGRELKRPIAADAKHVHFGGGQTETTVTLPPGSHTLQLVLGDWSHIPHNPPVMSPVITVTVK
jgi:hypothetical protein